MKSVLLAWLALMVMAPPLFAPNLVSPPAAFRAATQVWATKYRIQQSLASSIITEADRHAIPRDIAFRLVRAESGFKPGVRGLAGEVGLTQLLPSTARFLQPGVSIASLTRPEPNLRMGFGYLHRLYHRYGNWCLATTAYNMGPQPRDSLRVALALPNAYARRVLHPRRLAQCWR